MRPCIHRCPQEHPHARDRHPIEGKIAEFVAHAPQRVLLVAARAGMGKTSCALWLARKTQNLGRAWLFVSLPSVEQPFAPQSLVRHLQKTFGFKAPEMEELRRRPLVLILDSLDEVAVPEAGPPSQSWWELNGFGDWDVKLVVTCREDRISGYGQCLGADPMQLYIQGFGEAQMRAYLRRRLLVRGGASEAGPARFGQGAPAARRGGARATPAPPEPRDVSPEVQAMMAHIAASPLRAIYATPFILNMAVDLSAEQPHLFGAVQRTSELYAQWLRHFFERRGGAAEDDVLEAESLAWDLHRRGIVQAPVGDRGALGWFRRCPLRVHNFHPQADFSFKHKSIQEFLVASHVHRRLQSGTARSELCNIDLTRDFPVLRFFADICAGEQRARAASAVAGSSTDAIYQRLLENVQASQGHPELGLCAASRCSMPRAFPSRAWTSAPSTCPARRCTARTSSARTCATQI